VAEVECGDGVDLQLRQRLKALPFVSTSAVLLLVTANADTHLVANPRRRCGARRRTWIFSTIRH
jgi:hypothetical protein